MKTIDILPPKTYHDLTELEREKMINYYENHTLKECFEIHRDWLIERLGKDGKGVILKLLKLYEDEKASRI